MKIKLIGIFVFALVMLTAISCEVGDPSEQPAEVVQKEGKIFIRDNTGKEWDVTHAVNEYGFKAAGFQFGLGPFAIRPILDPQMLDPGDPNYPSSNSSFTVIGTTLNGDTRAYPLSVLTRHEIADETFGDIHVAVAYWPLVGLTAVYSREIDSKVLTLSASGWTYKNTFVLFDYETESLWYHLSGQDGLTCISGNYADRKLEELNSTSTRWSDWHNSNPQSKFLDY